MWVFIVCGLSQASCVCVFVCVCLPGPIILSSVGAVPHPTLQNVWSRCEDFKAVGHHAHCRPLWQLPTLTHLSVHHYGRPLWQLATLTHMSVHHYGRPLWQLAILTHMSVHILWPTTMATGNLTHLSVHHYGRPLRQLAALTHLSMHILPRPATCSSWLVSVT